MNILVTGGAGFVGSNVANTLAKDHNVLAVDNLKFGYADNLSHQVQFIKSGFEDLAEIYFSYFDVIVHAACDNIIYAMSEPVETVRTNTLKSIEMFKKFNKKIVYLSTSSVYGNADIYPTPEKEVIKLRNAYDMSKYLAEMWLEGRGNYTTLRLSNVYGPGQRPENPYSGVIGRFIGAALECEPLTIYGDGEDSRDYTYVDDVVDAVVRAVEKPATNCTMNISGGNELTANELVEILEEIIGVLRVEYVKKRDIDGLKRRWLDCSLAGSLLGWEAKTDMNEGLSKTLDYVQNNVQQRTIAGADGL